MSGRFYENEDYDIYGLMAAGRWLANERTVWKSKRGVRMLADMEAALLALPVRELDYGYLCRFVPQVIDEWTMEVEVRPIVCALGAFALYKGSTAHSMADADDQETSLDFAEGHDMTRHMAWTIGDYNDRLRDVMPKERWEKMYKAVKDAQELGRWVW